MKIHTSSSARKYLTLTPVGKKILYTIISSIALFYIVSILPFPQDALKVRNAFAAEDKKSTEKQGKGDTSLDGIAIMTKVSKREQGDDYIITTSWVFTEKGKERHKMAYTENRKNYRGVDDFNYKSVVRYTHPSTTNKKCYLVWNYKGRERAFWYFIFNAMRTSKRVTNVEFLSPPAESDFSLMDYVDINLEEETHTLLRSEAHEGKMCYVVESTPIQKDMKYGKRISWIDQQDLKPLKIDYYDRAGALWKRFTIKWQSVSGVWFWKKAVVENVQKEYKTFITIDEVKVNLGQDDREFTKVALEKIKF